MGPFYLQPNKKNDDLWGNLSTMCLKSSRQGEKSPAKWKFEVKPECIIRATYEKVDAKTTTKAYSVYIYAYILHGIEID